MTTVQKILTAARALPTAERAQLIDALWDSISPDDWGNPSQQWIAEAQRRSTEYDARRMTGSTWSEVRERLRQKLGQDG